MDVLSIAFPICECLKLLKSLLETWRVHNPCCELLEGHSKINAFDYLDSPIARCMVFSDAIHKTFDNLQEIKGNNDAG